ncbi:MAG: hypothetical protein ACK4UY_06055 [Dietzia sp.]
MCLFAANVGTILSDPWAFGRVLLVVLLFFVLVYLLGEAVARYFQLSHPEHALLTMTTSARNAPLMLAVTTIALPDQPVIAAAIVIGMLAEFPHLILLTHLLRRRGAPPAISRYGSAAARGPRVLTRRSGRRSSSIRGTPHGPWRSRTRP